MIVLRYIAAGLLIWLSLIPLSLMAAFMVGRWLRRIRQRYPRADQDL